MASIGVPTVSTEAIKEAQTVMDEVYGPFTAEGKWKPRPFGVNKARYLWTDGLAVCNYLSLFYETGDNKYLAQADALVQDVHDVLGRTRDGTARLGDATDDRPTRGGLRIGKEDATGPDCDGMYFHYLTKWMFALNRMSIATGERRYNDWACDLAELAHQHFVYSGPSGALHMFWKVSIDLSKPLVRSEGNLDPFDGLVTYRVLQARAMQIGGSARSDALAPAVRDLRDMAEAKWPRFRTSDPLDAGEALWLTHWAGPDEQWAAHVSATALETVDRLWDMGYFNMPLGQRLAFREFGTTLGVQVTPQASERWEARVAALHTMWRPRLFTRDFDITPVMYASSLCPRALRRGGCSNVIGPG